MPDYSKGKIYTIRCKTDDGLIYVGSTIQSLAKRLGQHKKDSNNKIKYPNHKLYSKIENWKDWYIELYENYFCNSVEELRKREGEITRQIGTLNRCIAGRTINEWKQDNPDKMIMFREHDKIKEIENGRREVKQCPCGGRFSAKSICAHKKSKIHLKYIGTQE